MKLKKYQLVLEESKTKKRQHISVQACDFSSAASEAYLKRHSMAYAGSGWKIISLSEADWRVIDLP